MKKLFLSLFVVASLLSCSSDDSNPPEAQNTIVGRWHLVGLEQTTMYEFTSDLRYTMYSQDGTFGDISTAIPNPNSWVMDGSEVVIDLNFGNESRFVPVFKCNGNIIEVADSNGVLQQTYFKEGYTLSDCNE